MQVNVVINGDGLEELKKLPSKSINLICVDPPYNIGKEDWDIIPDYYNWMTEFFIEFERVLKDNGSFFLFHNDFRILSELDRRIQEKTSFVYKNFIVWNKRFEGSKNKGFLDGYIVVEGLNNFQKMAEYIMYYTFDNTWKIKKRREELGVSSVTIGKEIPSKTGGFTGWFSNIETGKNYPTEKTIIPITKHLGLTMDDLVPKFRNQKTHHTIWNYDLDSKKLGHVTPKPIDLLKSIISHTTDEGDICLDCFGGSGSLGVAAKELGRNWILIEKDEKYCQISRDRIDGKEDLVQVKNESRKKSKTEFKHALERKTKKES